MNKNESIKRNNEEILKFLVKNQNDLKSTDFYLFDKLHRGDVKSFTQQLIKKTKNPAIELMMGMTLVDKNIISYKRKKRSDMENLLKSGNLGDIKVNLELSGNLGNAIKAFGKSS